MQTQAEVKDGSEAVTAWSEFDRRMMNRALELAAQGIGQVSPSPLVGCVIARETDGAMLGEGFYLYARLKHAEMLALEAAGANARGATAYVSLEPHAHQGRTPPCTDALIKAGISRIVAPVEDPNPQVSGEGFARLRAAGVRVDVGLCAHEASKLNEKYIHFMRTSRPFVHLKLACSLDGRTATRTGDSRWITNAASRQRVHLLRHEYDAILVGSNTAVTDNPQLTDRSGLSRRLPLARIVLDSRLRLSPTSQLALTAHDAPVLVFTSNEANAETASALEAHGVEIIRGEKQEDGGSDPAAMLSHLAGRSIQSVLVEGGATVAGGFLDAQLVDKISFFIAPLVIGGRDAPQAVAGEGAKLIKNAVRLHDVQLTHHEDDIEITGYPIRES
ncbi:MAG: bifunctional diaminohydroxyphosphoribosylaminopyrimidine deaminase/5-amino-6-(5-phosphoribosylamino)uracil reductase RibD [Pyrinomonadaceae bacterium]